MSVQGFPALPSRVTRPGVAVAVVGCGYWGAKHARVLSSLPDVSELFLVDPDGQTRNSIASAYPDARSSFSLQDVLPRVQAVVVATPPREHIAIAMQALRAGKHVLVEKPLTLNLTDAHALLTEATERNLVLMVGHTFEFNLAIRELRDAIDSGVLGDIRYISSARLNLGLYRRDVDVIWDLAPHDISIMNYLLRSPPSTACAWASSHVYEDVRDVAHFQLEYPNGVLGYGHVSWLDPRKIRQVTVVGSRRMAIFDDLAEEQLRFYDRAVRVGAEVRASSRTTPTYVYGDVVSPHIAGEEPLKIEDQHFLDCVNGRSEKLSGGRSGMTVVGVLEALDRSLSIGRKASVELFPVAPVSLLSA